VKVGTREVGTGPKAALSMTTLRGLRKKGFTLLKNKRKPTALLKGGDADGIGGHNVGV